MAQNQKSYDNEFKAQAVKLAQEIGGHKAAKELGILCEQTLDNACRAYPTSRKSLSCHESPACRRVKSVLNARFSVYLEDDKCYT